MPRDFLDDMVNALGRVLPSLPMALREILILSGMPEETENLRYLAYNRHLISDAGRELTFSAVAVINNRRMAYWRLEGAARKVSRIVFPFLWARRNPMDFFLNTVRCSAAMTDLLATSRSDYTLLGILNIEQPQQKHTPGLTRPVIAVPDLSAAHLETIAAFEAANQIRF